MKTIFILMAACWKCQIHSQIHVIENNALLVCMPQKFTPALVSMERATFPATMKAASCFSA